MGPLGASFGPLLGLLGSSWGPWGVSWGPPGASWGLLGAYWSGELDFSVRVLSWASLGAFLWLSWAVLGGSGGSLGALLGRLRALLGASWAVLQRSWEPLGRSWSVGKPKQRESTKYRKKQMKITDFGFSGRSWAASSSLLGRLGGPPGQFKTHRGPLETPGGGLGSVSRTSGAAGTAV